MENKYEIVERDLKEKILAGIYAINDKLPTESELMSTYGVSRYTIRRAVGDLENEHYIYRIQGGGIFIDDWQNAIKAPLKSKVIGVITTHIADYIFPNIITGIDRYISSEGYSILISNTQNNPEKERKSIQKMMESNLAGLIIEPTQSALDNPNKDLYQKIKDQELPTLFINAHYPELDFPYIEMDDFESGKVVTEQLIKLGHHKILGLFKIDDSQGVHRMNGFVKAYQERNELALLSEIVMYQSTDNMHAVFTKLEKILLRDDRPSAIICYNDQLAIQVIDLIRSIGLEVPADVSVMGFDNYQLSQYISPKLSTVEHPKEKMGRAAGKMILEMIETGTKGEPLIYEPKLVIRDSANNLKNK